MKCTWSPDCLFSPDGPAVARWESQVGNVVFLCQGCLDSWFDVADDDDLLEPAAWSWLPRAVAA